VKETRDGPTLHIDLDAGEAIDGPRELHGPLVIRSAEGRSVSLVGHVILQGPIEINGCRLDGGLTVPAGVTVMFAPSPEATG
jgi:hypothetical protein